MGQLLPLMRKKLPDEYTYIFPFHLPDVCPPTIEEMDDPVVEEPPVHDIEADEDWLNDPNPSSWAAFHAQIKSITINSEKIFLRYFPSGEVTRRNQKKWEVGKSGKEVSKTKHCHR